MRLLLQFIAILAAAGMLLGMQRSTPGYAEITGPLPASGRPGETIPARSFTLTVEKLVLAERIRYRAYGRDFERSTTGLWAVVVARLEARPESVSIGGALWRSTAGFRFEASQRVAGAPRLLTAGRIEPGLPARGILVFELPRDQAAGGTLLVSTARWPRLDSQARVSFAADAAESADVLDLNGLANE
ncbi:hypothetical protein FG93_03235 [Bosea sp. LC85]|uniref:hypothetical protein n=1 Tax=Bosea sp. LC85 TaxID=1502851 RepID=UPI0004E41C17|nr:hypothetical protein [Bosea sp. LC85]KFC69648.1 hypothetical protein FG93_03235 [Bosea sp. LC85]